MEMIEIWACSKPFDWNSMNGLLFNVPPFSSEFAVRYAQVGGKQ
jgi:hypothetical protein